jgi:small redox-active disulfide protein 2
MKLQILGLGCPNFLYLARNARRAAEELCLGCEIEKITDVTEIMRFRAVMKIPALAIDGEVKITRRVASVDEIKALLLQIKMKADEKEKMIPIEESDYI